MTAQNTKVDVDLSKFSEEKDDKGTVESLGELSPELQEKLKRIGLSFDQESSAGSIVVQDQSATFCKQHAGGIEVMSIKDALQKYEWVKDYLWKLIPASLDRYTGEVEKAGDIQGYFIRSLPNKVITTPVQTCLYLERDGGKQSVHNIIIAEEGSEMNIITGCTSHAGIGSGLHLGISEFYVKKDARVTFTMIHDWDEQIDVRPRTAITLEEGATFINNYVVLKPVKSIQSNPIAYLEGDHSRVLFQTIAYGKGQSFMDLGSRAMLDGQNTSAELITRAIVKDEATLVARGLVAGRGKKAKGHLECRGMIMSDGSRLDSIPELAAQNQDVEITHEAAVGKISQEEIYYLMARGLSEDEATSMIVNGFLSFDFSELPEEIAEETRKMIDLTMDAS